MISLIVSLVVGLGNVGVQVWKLYRPDTTAETRFAKIETTLRLLTATVAPQLSKAVDDSLAAALADPREAKDKLAYAGTVIRQLRQASIALPNEAVAKTGAQLNNLALADSSIPQTWATAGDFITYRSQLSLGWEDIHLPPCTDQSLAFQISAVKNRLNTSHPQIELEHGPIKIQNCKIALDSPETTAYLSSPLTIADIACVHCAIFYNGGPIVLIPDVLAGESTGHFRGNLVFKDCSYSFSLPQVPPAPGQRLTKELLEANLDTVRLSASDYEAM